MKTNIIIQKIKELKIKQKSFSYLVIPGRIKFILVLPISLFFLFIGVNHLFSADVNKNVGETTVIRWSSTDTRPGTCEYTSSPSQYPGWFLTGSSSPDSNLDPGVSLLLTQAGTYDLGVKCRGLDDAVDPLGEWVFDTVRLIIVNGADGLCGTANGSTTMQSIPSLPQELCTNGVASAVSGNGKPWTWTCDGAGTDASCSVYQKIVKAPFVKITPNTVQTITLGDSVNFTSLATSSESFLNEHHIDIQAPDNSWDYNVSSVASLGGVALNVTSYNFEPLAIGTYHVQAAAQNIGTTTWITTNVVDVIVNAAEANNERPDVTISTSDATGENEIVLGGSINILSRASSTGISKDITRHHIDYLPPGKDANTPSDWINNASNSIAFAETGLHNTVYTFKPNLIGIYTVKASACDDEAKPSGCRWTDSEYITVTVLPGPQDGVCGSSNGGSFEDIIEITDKCDMSTTPTPLSLVGSNWSWRCDGIYGSTSFASCGATVAQIEGEPIAKNAEIVYFPTGEIITEAEQEFLCITGRVEDVVWNEVGGFWTWNCVGNGVEPPVPGVAYVAPLAPVISFTGTPTSISKGTVIVLSWDIKNPNGFCRIRAKSASISSENIAEILRINKFLTRKYTDARDPGGVRFISKALTTGHPRFDNRAVGRVSVKINYPTDFLLSCSRDGTNAKRVKINITASNEG